MTKALVAKCSCIHCEVHLEFPVTAQGTQIDCPRCGKQTILRGSDLENSSTDSVQASLTTAELVSAFTGKIPHPPARLSYLIGLFATAAAMLLLPLLYVALIGLTGWLTWGWALHAKEILPNGRIGGLYAAILALYIAPLFVGTVLVVFMIKRTNSPRRLTSAPV